MTKICYIWEKLNVNIKILDFEYGRESGCSDEVLGSPHLKERS